MLTFLHNTRNERKKAKKMQKIYDIKVCCCCIALIVYKGKRRDTYMRNIIIKDKFKFSCR